MRRFVTVLAALTVLAGPAVAEEFTQSIPVTQADRQDPVAAAALYERVSAAAKTLCTKANTPIYGHPHAHKRAVETCQREAIDNAITHASMPSLAAVHAQTMAEKAPSSRITTIAAR